VAGAVLPSAALAAPVIAGFSARPLTSGNQPPRPIFSWHARQGATKRGEVLVSNGGAAAVNLRVYAVDGLTGVTSGAVYGTGDRVPQRDGTWLSTATPSLRVPAHRSRTISFTAQVPADARPGDHLAAIVLEDVDRPRIARGSVAIVEVLRVAVPVKLRVAGPASSQVQLGGAALRALPGTPFASVAVNLANDGQLICRPQLSVTLAHVGGPSQTVTRKLDSIMPGDAIPYPLPWPHTLAAGQYDVTAAATGCGTAVSTRQTANLGHALPGVGSVAPSPPARSSTPWMIVIVGIGGCLGGLLIGWLSSRRRRRSAEPPSS
jgi:hypothetical protein